MVDPRPVSAEGALPHVQGQGGPDLLDPAVHEGPTRCVLRARRAGTPPAPELQQRFQALEGPRRGDHGLPPQASLGVLEAAEIEDWTRIEYEIHVEEDGPVYESLQRNKLSPATEDGGLLSPAWESAVQAFYRQWAAALGAS